MRANGLQITKKEQGVTTTEQRDYEIARVLENELPENIKLVVIANIMSGIQHILNTAEDEIRLNKETANSIYGFLEINECGEYDLFWYEKTLPEYLESLVTGSWKITANTAEDVKSPISGLTCDHTELTEGCPTCHEWATGIPAELCIWCKHEPRILGGDLCQRCINHIREQGRAMGYKIDAE